MLTKNETLAFLSEHKTALFAGYQLVKIGLFGSFARNETTEESDIDIIVEFQPNTPNLYEKKAATKTLIKNEFDKEVDICREKYIKPYFKSQILQSAIYV